MDQAPPPPSDATGFVLGLCWLGVAIFVGYAIVWVRYHWPRWPLMDGDDVTVRGALLAEHILIAWGFAAFALGWPAWLRIPPLVIAGAAGLYGMCRLLWWDTHPVPAHTRGMGTLPHLKPQPPSPPGGTE